MEMWPTCSTLVFLTVVAKVISGQDPVILDEKSREVLVSSGSTLTFNCSLNINTTGRFWVTWHFNSHNHSFNDAQKFPQEILNKSAKTTISGIKQDSKTYTLSNATVKHRGWYFCKITAEIPVLKDVISNGTKVVITKSEEHTTHPVLPVITLVTAKPATVSPADDFKLVDWLLWIILGVSAFILIILLVVCILLRRRYRRSRAEDPIYANTHRPMAKQASPRPGMGNLKAVSSSQNLRNPSPGRRYEEGKQRPRQ